MESLEVFEAICETPDCGARATRSITSDGVVKSRHCTKHSAAALIAANKAEREKKNQPGPRAASA